MRLRMYRATGGSSGSDVRGSAAIATPYRWRVQSIRDQAAVRGVPVVAKNLDFRGKKAWLRQHRKRFGSILSNFRSRQVMSALERQCCRRGVKLIVVDLEWTTRIPREFRYQDRYRIGLHPRRVRWTRLLPRLSRSGNAAWALQSARGTRPRRATEGTWTGGVREAGGARYCSGCPAPGAMAVDAISATGRELLGRVPSARQLPRRPDGPGNTAQVELPLAQRNISRRSGRKFVPDSG